MTQKIRLYLIIILFWFSQYVYIPYQTPYLTACQVSGSFIGVVIGAYGMTQMLMRIPAGLTADRSGDHRKLLIAGQISVILANILRWIFPGGMGFLAANLFSGLSSAMWISYMLLLIHAFPAEEKGKATSQAILFNNAGVLAGFLWGTVFYDRFGMNMLVISAAAAAVAGLVLALGVREEHPQKKTAPPPVGRLLLACKNKRLIFFALLALVQQGVQMSTTMSFTTQILKDLGAGSAFIGLSSVFYMACAVVFSRMASGSFALKLGVKRIIPAVFLLVGVYCLAVPQVNSIHVIFALQLLPGLSSAFLTSYMTSEAVLEIPREAESTAMGFFQAVYAIGMTAFPTLTGALADSLGVTAAYGALAALAVAAGVAALVWYGRERTK